MANERDQPPAPDLAELPSCSTGGVWQLFRAAFAELVGLMLLVFVCTAYDGSAGALGGAVAGGFTLLLTIWLFGPISGGHINPAVTLYFCLTRRLSLVHTIAYWTAQVTGALLGCLAGKIVTPESTGMTMNSFSLAAFFAETWGTALLVLVVAQSVDELRGKPKLWSIATAVGFVVVSEALVIGPISGCSLNPARSLGPALANANLSDGQWVYVTAPFLGAMIATLLQEFVFCQDASVARAKMLLTKWKFDRTQFYGNRGSTLVRAPGSCEMSKV